MVSRTLSNHTVCIGGRKRADTNGGDPATKGVEGRARNGRSARVRPVKSRVRSEDDRSLDRPHGDTHKWPAEVTLHRQSRYIIFNNCIM